MRVIGAALLLLGGCDKLFSIDLLDPPTPDASPDAPSDVAIDAAADVVGCADGTREWLLDVQVFPDIAGCSGGWTVLGVHHVPPPTPLCPAAGNSNQGNPSGDGCDVSDLCAPGWHFCLDPIDVDGHLGGKPCSETTGLSGAFFITGAHSTGQAHCDTIGDNDAFGCGSVGTMPSGCGGIDRTSGDNCIALPFGWNCGSDGSSEAAFVTKTSAFGGGAMCCKN
ncbi:MAG TPA: hypothetical protein VL326_20130 [Kofleriaceae bacterium]|nr:hypothetical protein [Kofleriaceae bacterium]